MQDDAVLRVEIKNSRPVDLIDLTTSLMALAQSFQDYATSATGDPLPDNMRLYVKEMRSGSVIAELVTLSDQAQWIADNIEVLAAFVGNLDDLMKFFMGREPSTSEPPTRKQAGQIVSIAEPIAKDSGAQLNIQVMDGGVVNIQQTINITSTEANAMQNGARRFLGPALPASYVAADQLMTLEQVKNSAKAKTGDRGVIETVTDKPVKLQFLGEEAKRKVLELDHENPLQCAFLVDVEVRSVQGRPTLYRIIEVKDVIPKS